MSERLMEPPTLEQMINKNYDHTDHQVRNHSNNQNNYDSVQ